MLKMIKNKKAFTLIELIVTVAVLGILVLLASPRFFGHTQNAELTKGFANARTIQKASEQYYMDHEDWPRLTDDPYTSEEIESYSERIFNHTGQEVNLDPEGNYYDIDYDKLSDYVKVPDDKKNYILQNPVGKVFYMEGLSENGLARVDYSNEEEDTNPIPINESINFAYTGQPQSIELGKGTYKLEVWGAQGGQGPSKAGGKGGYSIGVLNIKDITNLHVMVGGKGSDAGDYKGGYNGGGGDRRTNTKEATGGGGGTDIRIEENNLYTRIIVAGGGGGGGLNTGGGGYGGGLHGGNGTGSSGKIGTGGTQKSAGVYSIKENEASFGVGGDGPSGTTGGGGGGGWYGGSFGTRTDGGGGGGSGYVLTESSYKPTGYNVHGKYYLTETELIAGDQSMPNPNGGTMTGNSGNGFARITRVER